MIAKPRAAIQEGSLAIRKQEDDTKMLRLQVKKLGESHDAELLFLRSVAWTVDLVVDAHYVRDEEALPHAMVDCV